MLNLTMPQVLTFWLQRHFLEDRTTPDQLHTVVSRICGLHAQVMSSAELAAHARIDGLGSAALSTALWQERSLVKIWAMRWTLHLFSAADFPTYVAAFGSFRHFHSETWLKSVSLTPDDMNALLEAFSVTLTADGLTREQLAAALAQNAGRPHLRDKLLGGWGTLLKPGAYQGHLLFGPNSGQNVTFVNPRHWLGDFPRHETHDAWLEIIRRYLAAYGPATPADFATWWGTSRANARKLFKALDAELTPVAVENREAWALHADAAALQSIQPVQTVRLLPGFDPYTLGLRREYETALPFAHKGRVFRQQGWISAVVLVGGAVVGVWNYEVKKGRAAITVQPFQALSRTVQAGIEQEAARLGSYFDAEPVVIYAG